MQSATRYFITTGLTVLACLGPAAPGSHGQGLPGVIEGLYPTQLVLGQTTVLHAAIPGRNDITAVEISPAAGITIAGIKRGDVKEGATWWEISVSVAKDAMPGTRMIIATGPMVHTAPRPLTIPAQVPTISELKIGSALVNQPTTDFQFAMTEAPNEIGDSPNVWFSLGCGGEPEVGVVKGKLANGIVRASIPNPRTQMKPFAPLPNNRCNLEVRASDSKMADSNTLKTAVDFK
jgi:hypothetical protein